MSKETISHTVDTVEMLKKLPQVFESYAEMMGALEGVRGYLLTAIKIGSTKTPKVDAKAINQIDAVLLKAEKVVGYERT